jgi:chromosome segregation ATPase
VETELANARSERDRLAREQGEIQSQAAQQRNDLQTQLARATDDLSARNREVAEMEGRLQTTRQELADAQGRLAAARQQLATPPSSESPSGAGAPTGVAPATPQ